MSERDRYRSANNIAAEENYKNDTQISARTVRRRLEGFSLGIEKDKLHLLKLISIGHAKIGKRYCFRTNRNSIASLLTGYGMLDVELAKVRKHSPICHIDGIMDRFQYMDILKNTMLPFARNNTSGDFISRNDNNPKHTARL